MAQDHLDKTEKNYQESLQVNTKLADAAGMAESNNALASLALEQNRPGEAESLARQAAEAFKDQKNADFETDALATLAHALVAEKKIPEARAVIDRAKGLPAQDQGVRLKLAIAQADVDAHDGNAADATRILTESIHTAVELKLKRIELEARLTKQEIESGIGPTASTKLQAKRLQADASAAGFMLGARKAGNLAK